MGSYFPHHGWNLCLLHWTHGVLTPRPPGKHVAPLVMSNSLWGSLLKYFFILISNSYFYGSTSATTSLHFENHQLTPILPIPIHQHKVHSKLPIFIFLSLPSDNEKPAFPYVLSSTYLCICSIPLYISNLPTLLCHCPVWPLSLPKTPLPGH